MKSTFEISNNLDTKPIEKLSSCYDVIDDLFCRRFSRVALGIEEPTFHKNNLLGFSVEELLSNKTPA